MTSRCCMCACLCIPLTVARQRLGSNITAVTNTHSTEELLDASFSVWPVSYRGKEVTSSSQNLLLILLWLSP
jgi:hypothetical protein